MDGQTEEQSELRKRIGPIRTDGFDGWMDGQMDRWMDGRTEIRLDGCSSKTKSELQTENTAIMCVLNTVGWIYGSCNQTTLRRCLTHCLWPFFPLQST